MLKRLQKFAPLFVMGIIVAGFALFSMTGSVQAAAPDAYGPPNDRPGTGTGTYNTCDPLSPTGIQQGGRRGNGNGQGQGQGLIGQSATPLSDVEAAGLVDAIEEEFGAMSLYRHVIDTLGESIPFTSIAASEEQHLNTLLWQADKYGIAVPELSAGELPTFSSLNEACAAGAAAEIADAALYDDLMAGTTHEDLIRVYTNLQSASLNSHLPEFELCQ